MTDKMIARLKNVPYSRIIDSGGIQYNEETPFEELKELLEDACNFNQVDENGKQRMRYELKIIKKTGTAKLFLFAVRLIYCYACSTTMGNEGCSYVNWLLGITNVNPLLYRLPFERFFHEKKECLPSFTVYIRQGGKANILKNLCEKYGENLVIRGYDDEESFFVSSKPIDQSLIKEHIVIKTIEGEKQQENISVLTSCELQKLNFYRFGIVEVETLQYSDEEKIDIERILEIKKELFYDEYRNSVPEFFDIEEIKEFLKDTEYKLIFQEQFMELCNKFLGIDYASADIYRKAFAQKQKEELTELKKTILVRYNEKGERLFNYFYRVMSYAVGKVYVVATFYNLIDYSEEDW